MTVTTRSLDPFADREPRAFDDRARRVMELRKQVREGTYRPDPGEIARAILDEWASIGDVVLRDQRTPSVETAADRREAAARFVVERTSEQATEHRATSSA